MYKFNEITIDDDKGIIFLCGTMVLCQDLVQVKMRFSSS